VKLAMAVPIGSMDAPDHRCNALDRNSPISHL
jgi:hypothetical protein